MFVFVVLRLVSSVPSQEVGWEVSEIAAICGERDFPHFGIRWRHRGRGLPVAGVQCSRKRVQQLKKHVKVMFFNLKNCKIRTFEHCLR